MKKLFLLLYLFLFMIILPACKKEQDVKSDNTATVNIINGIVTNDVLIKMNGSINNSGMNGSGGNQHQIYFGSNLFFFNQAKSTDLSVLNSTDSSVLATKNIDFKKGGIYTMLLAGIAPNTEAVVIDDSNMPVVNRSVTPTDADSVINIRFINLSPDVQPLDIRLSGSTTNEFTRLAYKGCTAFKTYPSKITGYFGTLGYSILNFEIVENGNVISTYTKYVIFPYSMFKNLALVLTGLENPSPGQPGLEVKEINYFQ